MLTNFIFDIDMIVNFLIGVGFIVAVFIAGLIIFVEALIIRLFKWDSFVRSLGASIVINMASGTVGYIIGLSIGWEDVYQMMSEQLLGVLIVSWAMTVIIEGGLLTIMNSSKWRNGLMVNLVANTLGYIGNGLFLLWIVPRLTLPMSEWVYLIVIGKF